MLSNKETAAEIQKIMEQCSETLNATILRVMDTCPKEEFEAYRQTVGKIMGSIYFDVMRPIHRQYSDLEPDELRKK